MYINIYIYIYMYIYAYIYIYMHVYICMYCVYVCFWRENKSNQTNVKYVICSNLSQPRAIVILFDSCWITEIRSLNLCLYVFNLVVITTAIQVLCSSQYSFLDSWTKNEFERQIQTIVTLWFIRDMSLTKWCCCVNGCVNAKFSWKVVARLFVNRYKGTEPRDNAQKHDRW